MGLNVFKSRLKACAAQKKPSESGYLAATWIVFTAFSFSPLCYCVFQEMKRTLETINFRALNSSVRTETPWEPCIVMKGVDGEVHRGSRSFREGTKQ